MLKCVITMRRDDGAWHAGCMTGLTILTASDLNCLLLIGFFTFQRLMDEILAQRAHDQSCLANRMIKFAVAR